MGQAAAQGEAYWRVHVEAWRSSGQSRGEYCALHGLSRKTFGWWAWRLNRQPVHLRSGILVDVQVGE